MRPCASAGGADGAAYGGATRLARLGSPWRTASELLGQLVEPMHLRAECSASAIKCLTYSTMYSQCCSCLDTVCTVHLLCTEYRVHVRAS